MNNRKVMRAPEEILGRSLGFKKVGIVFDWRDNEDDYVMKAHCCVSEFYFFLKDLINIYN